MSSSQYKKDRMYGYIKGKTIIKFSLYINGVAITNFGKFTHLGSLITLNGRYVTETEKIIGMEKEVFKKMIAVFKNRKLKLKTEMRVLICCAWSVFLQGRDAWTISESMKENNISVEMWLFRIIVTLQFY